MAERHAVKERRCGMRQTPSGEWVPRYEGAGCGESITGTAAELKTHVASHAKSK